MTTRKWKNEFLVNTTTLNVQHQSVVTALADGGFVISWLNSDTAGKSLRFQRYDSSGGKVGSEVNLGTLATGVNHDVEQLADGDLFIAFQNLILSGNNDASGLVVNLTGDFIRPQVGTSLTINNEVTPEVASLGSNGSVIVWQDASTNSGDIMMRIFNASGMALVTSTVSNTNTTYTNQEQPTVAGNANGSQFVVSWIDRTAGSIFARTFNSDGSQVAAEFLLMPYSASVENPVLVWLDNNRFVTVCDAPTFSASEGDVDSRLIHYSICSASGEVLGQGKMLANTTVAGTQRNPAVTALPNGGFVIAWEDFSSTGGDDSNVAIRLQAFNSVGGKVGNEVLVNTSTSGAQSDVSLAALADGRVVVSWTDGNVDPFSEFPLTGEIRAQIVDTRDGSIDGTSGSDTLYGHDAVGDVISAFAGADRVFGMAGADVIYGGTGNDTLHGERGDDTIYGGADADKLYGANGDDELYGEAGDDTFYVGNGDDTVNGGSGFDTVSYYARYDGAVVNLMDQTLNAGAAIGDLLTSIERVNGSNVAADILTGDNTDNYLVGYGGADTLIGNDGADTLRGGEGADNLSGGVGADVFRYEATSEGGDTISSFSSIDSFEFLRTAFGNLVGANVAAINFLSRASGSTATTAAHRFIFDQSTEQLWYDSNGSTSGGRTLIATIMSNAVLDHTDLLLV